MLDTTPGLVRNQLLAGLPEAPLARLASQLEPVKLPRGLVLERPGEPIEHVYFPASGVASVIAISPGGQCIEAGLFGRDGMSGIPVVLGADRSPHEVLMQMPGTGHRIGVAVLREAMAEAPALRERVLLFAQAFVVQTTHTGLANARLGLEARLARWLLMCHDRVDGDTLDLTHEFLSLMLGVRRAGVTVAVHVLEGRGLIKATRGLIRILDRDGLKLVATSLYGVPEAEYTRLLGQGQAEAQASS